MGGGGEGVSNHKFSKTGHPQLLTPLCVSFDYSISFSYMALLSVSEYSLLRAGFTRLHISFIELLQ